MSTQADASTARTVALAVLTTGVAGDLARDRTADLLGEPRPASPSEVRTIWAERKLAAALDSNEPTPGYLALAANLVVQPKRLWPSDLRQIVWPTRAYRDELGVTFGGQLRHVAREAVGR